MEFGKVSDKGGIIIPKKIRNQSGIHANDHIYFEVMKDGRVAFDKIDYKLLKNNTNRNYRPSGSEEKKTGISEGGEERKQIQGGTKNESLDKSGRSPQKTQSDTVRLSDKQDQPQTATTKRTPDQQRETQKEKIRSIGGEEPYGRIKENR